MAETGSISNGLRINDNINIDLGSTGAANSIRQAMADGVGITSITRIEGENEYLFTSDDVDAFLQGLGVFYGQGVPLTEEQVKDFTDNAIGLLDTLGLLAVKGGTREGEPSQEEQALANQVDALLKNHTISDLDIRELMKLLIKAFSQLLNSQRQVTLNTITNIVTALKAKIADMEKSKNENYHAALATAIGGIVMGALQIAGGVISMLDAGKVMKKGSAKGSQDSPVGDEAQSAGNVTKNSENETIQKRLESLGSIVGNCGGIANSIASIINAHFQAKAKDADIDSAIQDAIMEVLRKMQDEGSNEFKQLLQFISTLLQMLHELQQNVSSTEKTIVQA